MKDKTAKIWDKKTGGLVTFTPIPTKIVKFLDKDGKVVKEVTMNRKERRKAGIR